MKYSHNCIDFKSLDNDLKFSIIVYNNDDESYLVVPCSGCGNVWCEPNYFPIQFCFNCGKTAKMIIDENYAITPIND